MGIREQIESGRLVCPKTRQKLSIVDGNQWLENSDGTERYRFHEGRVPILLSDHGWAEKYAGDSDKMVSEYTVDALNKKKLLLGRIKSKLTQDYRTASCRNAFHRLFDGLSENDLCISIGGGPTRHHPRLLNVNIGPFPNVDIVADALCLPYSDGSIDAIHCEAVFEHLHPPVKAAEEMVRVLKPGKRAYVCTPFMQAYHGYPHHYQNYTLTGHVKLFESVGFRIVEAGVGVGPVYTMVNLLTVFIAEYFPYPFNKLLKFIWSAIGIGIRPLDKIVGNKPNAYILASTTYAILEKS